MSPAVVYRESVGELRGATSNVLSCLPTVMFSDHTGGGGTSPTARGLAIKYVARGRLDWRIGGVHVPVQEGQFMCVWQGLPAEVEVTASSTVGLCILVPPEASEQAAAPTPLEVPLVFSKGGSALGETLAHTLAAMVQPRAHRVRLAGGLFGAVSGHLEALLEDAARQLDGLDAVKPATRADALRRLQIARGHLYEVTDRPVSLGELARVAGMSRFHLLRNFRACFGAPPAAYHRRLRLELAHAALRRGALTCSVAAHRFGFADASSFSHAYRRTFGEAPTRSRAAARAR